MVAVILGTIIAWVLPADLTGKTMEASQVADAQAALTQQADRLVYRRSTTWRSLDESRRAAQGDALLDLLLANGGPPAVFVEEALDPTVDSAASSLTSWTKNPDALMALLDRIGEDGGYIASPSHDIPGDARPENIAAMYDEAVRSR